MSSCVLTRCFVERGGSESDRSFGVKNSRGLMLKGWNQREAAGDEEDDNEA